MDPERLREIAGLLRRLLEESPTRSVQLQAWQERSTEIERQLRDQYPDIVLPMQVMHYLHDGDLRAAEPAYREMQDKMLLELIDELERGFVPESRGITISL